MGEVLYSEDGVNGELCSPLSYIFRLRVSTNLETFMVLDVMDNICRSLMISRYMILRYMTLTDRLDGNKDAV